MPSLGFLLLLGLLTFCAELRVISGQPDFCHLPPDYGSCKGRVTRYCYNPASNKCEKFVYSGCKGNENNFKTQDKCHYTCVEKPGTCRKAPPGTITICPVMCGSDWDCPEKRKCCPYACKVECMDPL